MTVEEMIGEETLSWFRDFYRIWHTHRPTTHCYPGYQKVVGAVIARHGADCAIGHLGEIMEYLHEVEHEVEAE